MGDNLNAIYDNMNKIRETLLDDALPESFGLNGMNIEDDYIKNLLDKDAIELNANELNLAFYFNCIHFLSNVKNIFMMKDF